VESATGKKAGDPSEVIPFMVAHFEMGGPLACVVVDDAPISGATTQT